MDQERSDSLDPLTRSAALRILIGVNSGRVDANVALDQLFGLFTTAVRSGTGEGTVPQAPTVRERTHSRSGTT